MDLYYAKAVLNCASHENIRVIMDKADTDTGTEAGGEEICDQL
jgi:hypothetical protein